MLWDIAVLFYAVLVFLVPLWRWSQDMSIVPHIDHIQGELLTPWDWHFVVTFELYLHSIMLYLQSPFLLGREHGLAHLFGTTQHTNCLP